MKTKFLRISLLLHLVVLFAPIASVWAESPTVTLNESEGTYFLMENADYLLDKEKTANIEYALERNSGFQPIGKYFRIIAQNTGVWYRLKIKNEDNVKQDWVAVPNFTVFGEKIYLHKICGEKKEFFKAGRLVSEQERTLYRKHSLHSFLLSLEAKQECVLYLYIEDRNFNFQNFLFLNPEIFSDYEYYLSLFQGAYIGIATAFFFYNLFLLYFTKDKAYLYYICFVFFHLAYQVVYYRILNEQNLMKTEWFVNFWISITMTFTPVFLILFANSILTISKFYPRLYKTYMVMISIVLLDFIVMLIWGVTVEVHNFVFLFAILSLPYLGIREWIRGNPSARYFASAWVLYFIILVPAYTVGMTDLPIPWKYAHFFFYPVLFGSIVEMTLFSLALGDRYNQIQKRNETQAIQLLQDQLTLEEERHARRKIEMNLLKTIIQPHFLMNSLNTLVGLIWESPKKASDMIVALGAEVRNILEIPDVKEVTIDKELEFCQAYLKIMSLRLEENYALTTEGLSGDEKVPPLLFHTLIENAFTHAKGNYSGLKFHLRKELTTNSLLYTFSSTSSEKNSTPSNRQGIGTKYIQTALEEFAPGRWKVNQFYNNGLWVVKVEVMNG